MSDQELRQRFMAYRAEKGYKRTNEGMKCIEWDTFLGDIKEQVKEHMTEMEDELLWCELLLEKIKEMSSK